MRNSLLLLSLLLLITLLLSLFQSDTSLLRKKCPNEEFFLVRIFLYLDSTRNTGKYGPGETPYLDTFHAVSILHGSPFNIFI